MDTSPNEAIRDRFTRSAETWPDAIDRVASSIGASCGMREQYREALRRGYWVPSGQIWRGAGVPGQILYSCFVTEADPSESAADIAERITSWTERGCGVGVNVSSWVKAARGSCFSALQRIFKAVGASQESLWLRGITRTATMIVVDCDLPGIEAVVADLHRNPILRHINVAVRLTESFLEDSTKSSVAAPNSGLTRLMKLARSSWAAGNPGFIFGERANADHPFPDENIIACNPCAEAFLAPDEGCNLGTLNLPAFVTNGTFDWTAIREVTRMGVTFLDEVIEQSAFPNSRSAVLAKTRRRVGLGVMGFASALELLDVSYNSVEASEVSRCLASTIREAAESESANIARQKGTFPDFENSIGELPLRHAHLLSIPPTGATSLIWNVSSGIEPIFANSFYKAGRRVTLRSQATSNCDTALQIDYAQHIKIVSVWQEFIDGGISKTVNLPRHADPLDVLSGVFLAWKGGCKGISFFRDGSRDGALAMA